LDNGTIGFMNTVSAKGVLIAWGR